MNGHPVVINDDHKKSIEQSADLTEDHITDLLCICNSYLDKVLDVIRGQITAGKTLATNPSPVSSSAASEIPDSDPIGDLALERAHALSVVAVVVGAGAADEAGGK